MTQSDAREQLLSAAHDLFLEQGYRAGVDAIAGRAGVSKQTLYNQFGNKETLFGAVVNACSQTLTVPLTAGSGDLREVLVSFGTAFRARLLRPQAIALHRMLVGETPRFPDAAREVFQAGLAAVNLQLAGTLKRAMEAGALRTDDPHFAAGLLLSMLIGFDRDRLLFGCEPHADEAGRPERIVDLFLRAFAPAAPSPQPE